MFKKFLSNRLKSYVKHYLKANPGIRLVVIVGSTDKAMTRRAIGTVLAQSLRVRLQEHHRGDPHLAAPLAILGITMPANTHSPFAWFRVLQAASQRVKAPADIDVIVQQLPVRKPGDIAHYGRYLHPAIAVVTSVAPEHMDKFASIDAVASEYLAVGDMADLVIVNRDDVDSAYAQYERNANITTYGMDDRAEYWLETDDIYSSTGTPTRVFGPEFADPIEASIQLVGKDALLPAVAAASVGAKLDIAAAQIQAGLENIQTLPGRMNPLRGIGDTLILDDTYRAHPANAIGALQTLYEFDTAAQRIAVFSSFPDLGELSQAEHERVGKLCNPDLLAWVIMIGEDATNYMAPAARARGCQVKICRDAIEAGEFVRSVTERGAVILVEGAGPDTYLEETTKILCEMTEESKLVRQSEEWRAIKDEHFSRFTS